MLGSQHSAKHPANTSPLTALGCPALLSKESLCKQSLLLLRPSASEPSSPEGKRDVEGRCSGGWRESDTHTQRKGKAFRWGVKGRGTETEVWVIAAQWRLCLISEVSRPI